MFTKLTIVLAVAAVALCVEYPAGVHPAICPNYPYCDTAMLARYTYDGQPIPEWVYNPFILPHAPAVAPVPITKPAEISELALKYPAAINPALCPNYPYCDAAVLPHYAMGGRVLPEWVHTLAPLAPAAREVSIAVPKPAEPIPEAAKFPADFDSSLCPNYPFCE